MMALLTEIHYLFIQSPLDIKGECSQTTGFATVKSYCCGFVSYSWKEVTVSSLTQDDSVGLRLGVVGVVFDFVCYSIPRSHQLSFPCLRDAFLLLKFTPSDIEGCAPCLCAVCCCSIARSPSRSSDVVCLYWLERVTCICLGSLEGVCFCSQCCKQGGAPFPNHSVAEGYFHRSYFFVYHFGQ